MQTEFGINAWSIPSIGLFSDNGEDEFTIFNPENVYGSKESMRERYGEEFNPASDVFFKPKRLLLHSLIVYFSCMVQSNDIKDMQQKIINLYANALKYYQSLNAKLNSLEEQFQSEYVKYEETIHDKYKNICEQIDQEAELIIEEYLALDSVKKIAIPQQNKRITAMVAGGQASGKGSGVATIIRELEEQGIDWLDLVRVNTDSYKPLVLKTGTVDPHKYSQLAQPEASIIHKKLFNHLEKLASLSRAPHLFVDQVYVGADKIKYALMNGGKAIVKVISTEVSVAIERSFSRGTDLKSEERGRFEDTKNILRCHKKSTKQLPKTLANFLDQDLKVEIIDNNGSTQEIITEIQLNNREGYITFVEEEKILKFIKKIHINTSAVNEKEIYKPQIKNYFFPITNKKQEIVSSEPDSDISCRR